MTTPPTRPTTRDRILDALEALLLDLAPARITLEAVAEAAGVSKGGLLYHFATKSDLMVALVERHTQRSRDLLATATAAGRSVGEVYLELPTESWRDEVSLFRSAIATMRSDDGNDERLRTAVVTALRVWDEPLRQAVDDPVQAEIIRLVGDGLLLSALVDDYPSDTGLHRRLVARLLATEAAETACPELT